MAAWNMRCYMDIVAESKVVHTVRSTSMPTRIALVGWNGTWKWNSKDTVKSYELIR